MFYVVDPSVTTLKYDSLVKRIIISIVASLGRIKSSKLLHIEF